LKEKKVISATIVLYNEDINELSKTIDSFLNTSISKKLFLVDNSPTDHLKIVANHPDIEYIFNEKNVGFGAGHNRIINSIKNTSTYHLILNPDVTFDTKVIPNLIQEIEKQNDVAMIAPKVIFPNGEHQYTCRRYPTFFELTVRRISLLKNVFSTRIRKGEYKDKDLTKPFYPDFVQGCFMLFRTVAFVQINGFDESYFLYMEDVDICRKIDGINKQKMYYPNEEVVHVLKKGSSKKGTLFFRHLSSSLKYFRKWSS